MCIRDRKDISETGKADICLSIDNSLPDEAYTLEVSSDRINISSNETAAGFFYGVQSLLQLMPAAIYDGDRKCEEKIRIPAVSITDAQMCIRDRGMDGQSVRLFCKMCIRDSGRLYYWDRNWIWRCHCPSFVWWAIYGSRCCLLYTSVFYGYLSGEDSDAVASTLKRNGCCISPVHSGQFF